MTRYGNALSQTLANTSASTLLHGERIELAVIANQVIRYDEVAGVVFYSTNNEIIALSGNTDSSPHFTAPATLDDTITGYVSVVLAAQAFAPPSRLWAWLLSLLALGASPFVSLGILQFSARGNRSLPIVSVPEPAVSEPKPSFCLAINLHNQMALGRPQSAAAVADAMNMASEVCAIHQGIAVTVPERGVCLLFDADAVNAGHAVCAAFLMQHLLKEFETDGEFRVFLDKVVCTSSPADMSHMTLDALQEVADSDRLMTLAALARSNSALLSEAVYAELSDTEKTWTRVFAHPLLEDLPDSTHTYSVDELPEQQARLVASQAMVILGFSQASA